MAHRTPGPLRTAGVLLRTLIGLAALVALTIGAPYLLLAIGHQPTELSGGLELLMRPDDGTLFLVVLTLIGWAGWTAFTLSVLVEIVAVLRRRSAPRIKGMGGLQSLASFLIGGIVLLAPTAASAATTTPAVAVGATHITGESGTSASPSSTQDSAADETDWPEHTVNSPTQSPWDLAEEYLGNGQRWKDIAALNPDIPELTAGDAYLPQGAIIKLPADSRPVAPATTPDPHPPTTKAPAADDTPKDQAPEPKQAADNAEREPSAASKGGTKRPESVTIHKGDSLWSIADTYGDPTDWPEIYEANRHEPQPGGSTFTNPNLIFPGQKLDIPSEAAPTEPDHNSGSQERQQPTPESEQGDSAPDHTEDQQQGGPATPSAPQEKPSSTTNAQHPGETAPPESTAPAVKSPSAKTGNPAKVSRSPKATPDAPAEESESIGQQSGIIGLIATGVLASGFLSTLAARRIMQQRRRRRGRRIALPQADAARNEQAMRTAETTMDTSQLDVALRTTAVHLTEAERELPQLAAALIGPREIVLHLAEPAEPVPPFTAEPETLERWTCPAGTPEILPPAQTDDVESPYPALISLGWDADGQLLLVDLEHIGHLHFTGPSRLQVLRTIALELATSEFTHHADISAVGDFAPGLEAEFPERLAQRDLAGALAAVRSQHTQQQRALTVFGSATMRAARTGIDTAAAWTPHLVLAENVDPSEAAAYEQLLQTIGDQPRSATALVTTGEVPGGAPEGAWKLHADPAGPVRLPVDGVELDCYLQALSDEDYAFALEVLATSGADDVPAEESNAEASDVSSEPGPSATPEPIPRLTPMDTPPDASGPGPVPSLLAQFASYEDELEPEPEPDRTAESHTESDTAVAKTPAPLLPQPPRNSIEPEGPEQDTPGLQSRRAPVPARKTSPTLSIQLPEPAGEPKLPLIGPGAQATGPVIRVLGPVDIVGARGTTETKRKRTSTELAAWLILRPGLDHHALDEAMWPGREVGRKYRNSTVSRLRTWLGTDDEGNPYLPVIATTSDARYALAVSVTSDLRQFEQLVHTGMNTSGPHANQALREALELVRGRPFSSVDRRRYAWAEHMAQDMISAIVDAAHELAERCLAGRDPRGALWAATKGLDAAPEMESLYQILFQAYAAIGDFEALERAAHKLDTLNMELGVDMEEATAAILSDLAAKT